VSDKDKAEVVDVARDFVSTGFKLLATKGTHEVLSAAGIPSEVVNKLNEGRPDIYDLIMNGQIDLIINTPIGADSTSDDSYLRKGAIKKKIPYITETGELVKPTEPNGYKFEKFIFDSLCDAKSVALMAFDRNEEFSPVKNAEGKDSPASCRADLQAKWRRQLSEAGITVPDGLLLEIDPVYALDSADIKATGLLLEAGI
jgi:hypothetical protein